MAGRHQDFGRRRGSKGAAAAAGTSAEGDGWETSLKFADMYGVFTISLLIQAIAFSLWALETVTRKSISELFGFKMPPDDDGSDGKSETSAYHVTAQVSSRGLNGDASSPDALTHSPVTNSPVSRAHSRFTGSHGSPRLIGQEQTQIFRHVLLQNTSWRPGEKGWWGRMAG